jgi:hypothetical protein
MIALIKDVIGVSFFLICFCTGCSIMALQGGISLQEIEKTKGPLAIKNVEARFGKYQHGHGPYIWYECKEIPNREYWFWFLPISQGIDPKEFEVAFITIVNTEDPDDFEIVWPKDLKQEKDKRKVFELYNKRLEEAVKGKSPNK